MKFVLLLYVSRSGSTFLASELAKSSKDILVLPELNLVKWLVKYTEGSIDQSQCVSKISKERRWASMDISAAELNEIISQNTDKLLEGLLVDICKLKIAKLGREMPEYVVLKKGDNVRYVEKMHESLGDKLSILHVYRDLRAVYNSMHTAKRIKYPTERLSRGNPLFVARLWCKYLAQVNQLSKSVSTFQLSYEDLIDDKIGTINKLLTALELERSDISSLEVKKYLFQVHDDEKNTLHKKVEQNTDNKRIAAFQSELSAKDIQYLETWAGSTMLEKGYEISNSNSSFAYRFKSLVVFVYRQIGFYILRIKNVVAVKLT